MKKFFSLFTAAVLTAGMSTTALASEINVTVDGAPVQWTDATPFINEDNRTLVPLRPIANALGLTVTWDSEAKQASFTDGSMTAIFTIDNNICQISTAFGEANVEMDTAAVVSNVRTYAPARYLAESFGYTVGWDNTTKSVTISSEAEESPEEEGFEDEIFDFGDVPEEDDVFAVITDAITAEAGAEFESEITISGNSLLEDLDFFSFPLEMETELEFYATGFDYSFTEENRIPFSLQTALNTTPGEYVVNLTIPSEWFVEEPAEPVIVPLQLTVTEPSLDTALDMIVSNIEGGIFAEEGASAADISATIADDAGWILYDTPFTLAVSEGVFDEAAAEWTGTLSITDGEEEIFQELTISVEALEDFSDIIEE